MNREEIKEAVKVMEAYADGKKVQKQNINGLWIDCDNPKFDWASFNYRIKPEPKHRPFKTQEECWNEMHKHPDFGWICRNEGGAYVAIQEVGEYIDSVSFKDIFDTYTFTDGEPFGIKEE